MTDEHDDNQVIVVRGLRKTFGAVEAVADVSFGVAAGRITGFLGPNGAGKTTTLRMILGLCRPTAGSATIDGVPYRELEHPLRRVGAALDGSAFSPKQTARDHLRFYAPLAGVGDARVDELLGLVGLSDAARRRVGEFSLGMKQRLALATALLGRPDVLVLDEPSNGLDPAGIHWLRAFLQQFAAAGGAVLLSSHLLSEVEQMVDDVVLIDHGRLLFDGPLGSLVSTHASAAPTLESAFLSLTSTAGTAP